MNTIKTTGFTIIELMIALVVGSLMMAMLVGLSGQAQRSYGRNQDVTDLQANLRFAMRVFVDDLARAGYMYSSDPMQDPMLINKVLPAALKPNSQAIFFDDVARVLTLRGNYISTRDYWLNLISAGQGMIRCRNGQIYNSVTKCPATDNPAVLKDNYDNFLEPFKDGPGFDRVFCAGAVIRMDAGNGFYSFHEVNGISGDQFNDPAVDFLPTLNRDRIQGGDGLVPLWVSPVTSVDYELVADPKVVPTAGMPTQDAFKWDLMRTAHDCRALPALEIANFLLDPADALAPGLSLAVYVDTAGGATGGLRAGPYQPVIDMDAPINVLPGLQPVNWLQARALAVTLRGRTDAEDPNFVIADYAIRPDARNFGVDLDGDPSNGLARVRVEHTVIQLRNMAMAMN